METKQIGIILGIILMIGIASAITIYSGSSYSFASEEFEYWEVVGNSSPMDGMNVTWEAGNITITFDPLFAADTFTLIFFNNYTEIINEYPPSDDCDDCDDCDTCSGGGTRIVYRDRNITLPGETIVINETIINLDETPLEEEKTIPWWLWASIIFLIGVIVLAFLLTKNKPEEVGKNWDESLDLSKYKSGEKEESTND